MIALAALFLCIAIDGDTLSCGEMRVRLAAVDAPEMHSRCPTPEGKQHEERLAIRARDYVAEFVRLPVEIIPTGEREKYGRILAHVRRGPADLGDALIAAGLARRWEGRRETWCDGGN